MPASNSTNALRNRLVRIIARLEARDGPAVPAREEAALQVERWEIVVALLEVHPFVARTGLRRSVQWREAADWIARRVPCPELAAWVRQQAEIATNIERGVRDLRPRKDGPCHGLMSMHARARRQKAVAVQRWMMQAGIDDADAAPSAGAAFSASARRARLQRG